MTPGANGIIVKPEKPPDVSWTRVDYDELRAFEASGDPPYRGPQLEVLNLSRCRARIMP